MDRTEKSKDGGANDLIMSDALRTDEIQVWFLVEHLVEASVVQA